jgi:UPF0716 protein FxsA
MLARILLLFLMTPVVEFILFVQVNELIGFWPTIGLILATGVVGGSLAKREGLSTWRRLNERLADGSLPGNELVEGVIILVAGALLITPGVLTDVIGFLGLFPPTRALLRRFAIRRLKRKMDRGELNVQMGVFGVGPASEGGVSFRTSTHGAGGPAGGAAPSGSDGSSEAQRQGDASWRGQGRNIPGYADDVGESGSGGEERDAV